MLVGGRSGPSRVGMVMRGGWHKWSIMLISYNSKSDPEQRHITSREMITVSGMLLLGFMDFDWHLVPRHNQHYHTSAQLSSTKQFDMKRQETRQNSTACALVKKRFAAVMKYIWRISKSWPKSVVYGVDFCCGLWKENYFSARMNRTCNFVISHTEKISCFVGQCISSALQSK